jgi:hypothetical protein
MKYSSMFSRCADEAEETRGVGDRRSQMKYEAFLVNKEYRTWMVRRFKPDKTWDEALIASPEGVAWTEQQAIDAATARESWA